jgi:hypothetical protein
MHWGVRDANIAARGGGRKHLQRRRPAVAVLACWWRGGDAESAGLGFEHLCKLACALSPALAIINVTFNTIS